MWKDKDGFESVATFEMGKEQQQMKGFQTGSVREKERVF